MPQIIIETHKAGPGTFRAEVVGGPAQLLGWVAYGVSAASAYASLKSDILDEKLAYLVQFIHAEV